MGSNPARHVEHEKEEEKRAFSEGLCNRRASEKAFFLLCNICFVSKRIELEIDRIISIE